MDKAAPITHSFYLDQIAPRLEATNDYLQDTVEALFLGIVGVQAGCLSLLMLGTSQFANECHRDALASFERLFADKYYNFLKIINPSIECPTEGCREGFITDIVKRKMPKLKYHQNDTLLRREVGTRLSHIVRFITYAVSRVFDAVIGIALTFLSLATLGKFPTVNRWAYQALQVTGIVKDFFYHATKLINPAAKFKT